MTGFTYCYTDLNSKWFLEKEPLWKSKKCVEGIFRKMCACIHTYLTHTLIHTVPNLHVLRMIFDFMMVRKWYTFSGNCTSDLECWSFPRPAICSTILSCNAGQLEQLPVGQAMEEVKQSIQPTVCCAASIFGYYVLCFHILSCLWSAHQHLPCFWGEEEESNYSWGEAQDNCPSES